MVGRKYKCLADLVTDYNEEHNGLVTALKYPVHVEHNPNDDEDKDSEDDEDDDDGESWDEEDDDDGENWEEEWISETVLMRIHRMP